MPNVRAAADDLKAAIDRHLEACVARGGESDPAVQEAYDALRVAAERYDDALFEEHDEVTPFEFADAPDAAPVEVAEQAEGGGLVLLVRRDYDVVDDDALSAAAAVAQAALDEAEGERDDDEDDTDGDDAASLLGVLLEAYGVDGLALHAEQAGLEPVGGTVWLLEEVAGDIEDDPFGGVDEERLRYRVDELYAD